MAGFSCRATDLALTFGRGPRAGRIRVSIDDIERELNFFDSREGVQETVHFHLVEGVHRVVIRALSSFDDSGSEIHWFGGRVSTPTAIPFRSDPQLAAYRGDVARYGTSKGRRFPIFALGLNGVGGYRLQVSPAKKVIELLRADAPKTSVPYQWESGEWTHMRLHVRKSPSGWKIEGKAWAEGKAEPASWMITTEDADDLPAGRAGVFASPFSGTPVRFDDLLVERIGEKPAK